MEELGKYQSIQDRIKRLTKNQNANTGLQTNDQDSSCLSKFRQAEDNRKQNNPQFTLSKKRQNSTTDYKQLLSSLSPKLSKETNFQLLSYGTTQPVQEEYIDTKTVIRNSQTAYFLQKPIRQQKENGRTQREYTNLTKRNESTDDVSALLAQKYPSKMYLNELYDSTNQPDKSLAYQYESSKYEPSKYESSKYEIAKYEPETLTKRKQLVMERKKSMNNLTYRPGYTQLDSYLPDKYQSELRQIKREEDLGLQRVNTSTEQNFAGRMLKKCRSGLIERVPGKIMRNK